VIALAAPAVRKEDGDFGDGLARTFQHDSWQRHEDPLMGFVYDWEYPREG
jgi:hypothetical protein